MLIKCIRCHRLWDVPDYVRGKSCNCVCGYAFIAHSDLSAIEKGCSSTTKKAQAEAKREALEKETWRLSRNISELKKDNPDKAIEAVSLLLEKQKELKFPKTLLLETRLRIGTILYENKRFKEAEKVLISEFNRKYSLSSADYRRAEKKKEERERYNEISREYGFNSSNNIPMLDEYPDFERNLYFKKIYQKLRTCYERMKRFDRAAIFAVLELYSEQENNIHGYYSKDNLPDWSRVEKNLIKNESQDLLAEIKHSYQIYFDGAPNQDKCRKLYDVLKEKIKPPKKPVPTFPKREKAVKEKPVKVSNRKQVCDFRENPDISYKHQEKPEDKKITEPTVYAFYCPHCNQKYEGTSEYIGIEMECHYCHKEFILTLL